MAKIFPHTPVMLEETSTQLLTNPDGIYLDGTVGYGGHASFLIKQLTSKGKLIGLDLDLYALEYTQKLLSSTQTSYSLHHGNFREYPNLLQKMGINKLTGILFDLGSSSSQINTGHRGFSFQSDAALDMRFNPKTGFSARDYLNNANEDEISKIIHEYGEERRHAKIAQNIYTSANHGKMNSTFDLRNAVEKAVNPKFLTKSLARVFQAVRIKVNDELNSIREALFHSTDWLISGGRIVVISFHSLEDRLVKHFLTDSAKSCVCPREYPVCVCDTVPTYKILTRKAITPNEQEVKENPRSRSAKLRAAERV